MNGMYYKITCPSGKVVKVEERELGGAKWELCYENGWREDQLVVEEVERPCQCGSGWGWSKCKAGSQYCG